MILTRREKTDIEKWRHELNNDLLLNLSIKDDDAGHQIHSFCVELADLVPEITLKSVKEKDIILSGIMVSPNIMYSALPVVNELRPFLNALSMSATSLGNIPGGLQSALLNITTPAIIKIYISPHCPFCPQVVTRCLGMARLNPVIKVSVIDGNLFPEEAKKNKIRSVPTLILDDSFRWNGPVDLEKLIKVIAQRDSMLPGIETLKNIIHDGRAEEIAEMMVTRGQVFPTFIELLTDINWNVRLGAMVVFEYLVEKSPTLIYRVNVDLCDRFPDLEDRIQGDIIYLLGESGDRSIVPFLKSVTKGSFTPEVMEAAADALENLT